MHLADFLLSAHKWKHYLFVIRPLSRAEVG